MLHALVEEWGEGEKRGESAMIAWGSQKGLKPPEPNTRATALPLRAHTLLHGGHTKHKTIMEATPKSRG